jgi:hypothetical protein
MAKITLFFLERNVTGIVSDDDIEAVVLDNIQSPDELIARLNTATTAVVGIADPIVTFNKKLITDVAGFLYRSRHVKALTAAAPGWTIGETNIQQPVAVPLPGLILYNRDAVYFEVPQQRTDSREQVLINPYDWARLFRVHIGGTLCVGPVFYRRIRLADDTSHVTVFSDPVIAPPPLIALQQEPPTPANTIFVSVAAYGNPHEKCDRFVRSARKFNIPIRFLSWGEPWHGFVFHKFYLFLKQLNKWRNEGFRYAFVLDGFDVVFTSTAEVCVNRAGQYCDHNKLTFNKEYDGRIFPYNELWFRKIVETEGCHLNAGAVFGAFDVFEEVITYTLEIQREMFELTTRAGTLTTLLQDKTIHSNIRRYANDDQLLYQLCSLYYPQYFAVDAEKRVMSWVPPVETSLGELRKQHYSTKSSVGESVIIHSSGSARKMNWTAWCQQEGLVVD